MTMKKLAKIFAALLLLAAPAAWASESDIHMEPALYNRLDIASQQRGLRTFVNYCLNCHSAKYMRYNRLTDLGIDISMIQDNLMFATSKVGETMNIALTPRDAKAFFGTVPPDLTVEARVRGANWLYNYLLGFYKDDTAPTGWNNLVFPGVAMPHVLYELSGTNTLVTTEFKEEEEAIAAALAAKGVVVMAPGKGGTHLVKTLTIDKPGTLTPVQYRAMIGDLVNFMEYMAEPAKNQRVSLGLIVLLYLVVLWVFAYWMKREFWKDVH
jgi:ubiquinol-cytochrome c reductase cytochrome c1 subunit